MSTPIRKEDLPEDQRRVLETMSKALENMASDVGNACINALIEHGSAPVMVKSVQARRMNPTTKEILEPGPHDVLPSAIVVVLTGVMSATDVHKFGQYVEQMHRDIMDPSARVLEVNRSSGLTSRDPESDQPWPDDENV